MLLTARPRLRGDRLAAAGWTVVAPGAAPPDPRGDVAIVGSPAEWQTEWRALGTLRSVTTVLADG